MREGIRVMHRCQANSAPDAKKSRGQVGISARSLDLTWKTCNLCRNHATVRCSALQRLEEVPQFHGRKLPETLLDIPLVPLQEHPARHAVPIAIHEVHPPAHRAELAVGLDLEEHVPMIVAAIELPHVFGPLLTGKCHAPPHAL